MSILLIVPLPFILVWTAIASRFLVGRLEAIFLESQLLQQDSRFIRNLGLFGAVVICGSVFLLCLMPEFSVRRGLAVQREIDNMPQHLKTLVVSAFYRSICLACSAIVGGACIWVAISGAASG